MQNPFSSYFIGGFECADHLNRAGDRVNLLKETEHHLRTEEDYRLLLNIGITSVREGIIWSAVEKIEGEYDFAEVLNRLKIAERLGIQVTWDLIHFGYPDGLFPTHPKFCERFENLTRAFARFYKSNASQPLLVCPINEISFLSWFSGEARGTVPYAVGNGWDIKYHLCRAAIKSIEILKAEIPDCTIVMVEPLIKVHSDGFASDDDLIRVNEYQFEACDIISGRLCPELGGREEYLEILGANYYWNSQWTGRDDTIYWPDPERKRTPLHEMIQGLYARYKKPIFLSETGHFGSGRVEWIEETANECAIAHQNGVPFWGICIYPVTDRPDWDNLSSYSNCGIFDLDSLGNRIPEESYINSIRMLDLENSDLFQNSKL